MGRQVADEALIEALKASTVFSALKPDELLALAKVAEIEDFDPNQLIVNEGDHATVFYLILSGVVEVRKAKRPVARLGRGQFFGETTLMGDMTRSPDVLAIRKTRCMVMSGSELRSYPAVALKVMGETAIRDQAAAPWPNESPASPEPASTGTNIEFKSEDAKLLFNHLVKSFTEDYMVKRLYFEQAGWRTFSELAKATSIPRATLYGEHGSYGAKMNELLGRGLIEMRVFTGQRGRGGEVLRVRIAYDREPVKRYVDRAILKRKSDRQSR